MEEVVIRDPLVLLGDLLTGGAEWRRVRPLLANAFELLEVDMGKVAARRSSGGADLPFLLAEELVRGDVYPVHLLASTFASGAALGLAEARPDLFRSLLLHAPLVELERDRSTPTGGPLRGRFAALARALEKGSVEEATREWLSVFGEPVDTPVPELTAEMAQRSPTWLAEFHRADAWRVRTGLRDFLPPTLLVGGELEPVFLQQAAAELTEHLTNATRLRLPGAGHLLPFTEPARFAGVVMSFCLERNVPTA